MPVIAVAIAALPAVAILLAIVTRMETSFFGDGYDRLLTDALQADGGFQAPEDAAEAAADGAAVSLPR